MKPKIKTVPVGDTLATLNEPARKLAQMALEKSRFLFEKYGQVQHVILALPMRGEMEVFDACHANDTEKAIIWALLRFIRQSYPVIAHVAETWMAAVTMEEQKGKPILSASQHPNRTECVLINLWEGKRMVSFMAAIRRNPNRLEPFVTVNDTMFPDLDLQMEGMMVDGPRYKTDCN